MKKCLVLGGGGFIGHNLVTRLKELGCWVRAVDLKYPEYEKSKADDFIIGDLTENRTMKNVLSLDNINEQWDEVFSLSSLMGGAGYVFSKVNDADIMLGSSQIHINLLRHYEKFKKVFFSSSACIYGEALQKDKDHPDCREETAWMDKPDSSYGVDKLYSEELYLAFQRCKGVDVKIARFHNIFGINGTYKGGKEKYPSAITRKVIEAPENGTVEIWGDGTVTRSFLNIHECIDGILKFMNTDGFHGPVNIGSEEMISVNNLAKMVVDISGRTDITLKNIPSNAIGVNGRNSENTLCRKMLNWEPKKPLREGMEELYSWIYQQIKGEPFRK